MAHNPFRGLVRPSGESSIFTKNNAYIMTLARKKDVHGRWQTARRVTSRVTRPRA